MDIWPGHCRRKGELRCEQPESTGRVRVWRVRDGVEEYADCGRRAGRSVVVSLRIRLSAISSPGRRNRIEERIGRVLNYTTCLRQISTSYASDVTSTGRRPHPISRYLRLASEAPSEREIRGIHRRRRLREEGRGRGWLAASADIHESGGIEASARPCTFPLPKPGCRD